MKWFVYVLGPIDYWNGWHMGPEFARELREDAGDETWREFMRDVTSATHAARIAGYDGIARQSLQVAPLPRSDDEPYGYPRWMFGVKQDNNGTTFIISPYRLPWLGDAKEVLR